MKERTGSHLSLFLIVSAAGEVMKPYVLLHGGPRNYVDTKGKPIICFQTKKGYMEKEVFFEIMQKVFIPYVEKIRKENNLVGRRAVLVLDGHPSRYSEKTAELLKAANIILLILPSHSSHVTQPLDLGLNHFIKNNFRRNLMYVVPIFPLPVTPKKGPGRPVKKRMRTMSPEELLKLENKSLCSAMDESAEETKARVKTARYERARTVIAVIEAIQQSLTWSKIKVAWATSNLYPMREGPHYTREQEELLQRQLHRKKPESRKGEEKTTEKEEGAAKPKLRLEDISPPIGVLTSENGLARLKAYVEGRSSSKRKTTTVSLNTVQGETTVLVEGEEN